MRSERSSRTTGRWGSSGREGCLRARGFLRARFKSGMGCGEAGDWNAVGRAGDVIQADRMAELHGARFTAMFTADTDLQLRADAPTGSHGNANQLPNTVLIQDLKRIVGKYTTFDVIRKEATRIVSAQSESRLGQIIGSKGKKLGGLRDLIRGECSAWQLDHGADGVGNILSHRTQNLLSHLLEHSSLIFELFDSRDERDHDLRTYIEASA